MNPDGEISKPTEKITTEVFNLVSPGHRHVDGVHDHSGGKPCSGCEQKEEKEVQEKSEKPGEEMDKEGDGGDGGGGGDGPGPGDGVEFGRANAFVKTNVFSELAIARYRIPVNFIYRFLENNSEADCVFLRQRHVDKAAIIIYGVAGWLKEGEFVDIQKL